ncbi:hypothetical protein LCGC14_1187790 [marine sediment metagenome]|uniref:Uncharacterized protein n=1 Tax=marine sediment metagenome TaxID=412755 RepID=A0A0F9M7Z4_9ZZZZ
MEEILATIREVREGGQRVANHYLSRGYVLLDVQGQARSRRIAPQDARQEGRQYYVQRQPVYVVGRPEGVEECEPPPRWRPPATAEAEAEATKP